ncbi:MAG TPA: hypothetical protein VLZ30_09135 [Verrucomicrobiae bacterium]|nr:hypothetical protein [Verrucomicrobiae bacterium]
MSPSKYDVPANDSVRVCRWLMLMALALGGFCARADTVKLKDGTVLEGDITSQDDTTLSIYLEFAGGTITQTRQIKKADIASVVLSTPEEKAVQQAARDYEKLRKYQLNPKESYDTGYYDQIIKDVFRTFLREHPNSPHVSNVTARIAEWTAERDLVAAGNVKFHGRWSPASEAAPLIEREHGLQLLQQARTLIDQHRFEPAIQQLQIVLRMERQPDLIALAKPLMASAYQPAVNSLEQQRQQWEKDVFSAQHRVDLARQALGASEARLTQLTSSGGSHSTVEAQIEVNRARGELDAAQSNLNFVKSQLDASSQRLIALKSQAPRLEPAPPAPQPPKAQPAPATPAGQPEVLVTLTDWARNNWVAMAIIGVAILFLIYHFLIKD